MKKAISLFLSALIPLAGSPIPSALAEDTANAQTAAPATPAATPKHSPRAKKKIQKPAEPAAPSNDPFVNDTLDNWLLLKTGDSNIPGHMSPDILSSLACRKADCDRSNSNSAISQGKSVTLYTITKLNDCTAVEFPKCYDIEALNRKDYYLTSMYQSMFVGKVLSVVKLYKSEYGGTVPNAEAVTVKSIPADSSNITTGKIAQRSDSKKSDGSSPKTSSKTSEKGNKTAGNKQTTGDGTTLLDTAELSDSAVPWNYWHAIQIPGKPTLFCPASDCGYYGKVLCAPNASVPLYDVKWEGCRVTNASLSGKSEVAIVECDASESPSRLTYTKTEEGRLLRNSDGTCEPVKSINYVPFVNTVVMRPTLPVKVKGTFYVLNNGARTAAPRYDLPKKLNVHPPSNAKYAWEDIPEARKAWTVVRFDGWNGAQDVYCRTSECGKQEGSLFDDEHTPVPLYTWNWGKDCKIKDSETMTCQAVKLPLLLAFYEKERGRTLNEYDGVQGSWTYSTKVKGELHILTEDKKDIVKDGKVTPILVSNRYELSDRVLIRTPRPSQITPGPGGTGELAPGQAGNGGTENNDPLRKALDTLFGGPLVGNLEKAMMMYYFNNPDWAVNKELDEVLNEFMHGKKDRKQAFIDAVNANKIAELLTAIQKNIRGTVQGLLKKDGNILDKDGNLKKDWLEKLTGLHGDVIAKTLKEWDPPQSQDELLTYYCNHGGLEDWSTKTPTAAMPGENNKKSPTNLEEAKKVLNPEMKSWRDQLVEEPLSQKSDEGTSVAASHAIENNATTQEQRPDIAKYCPSKIQESNNSHNRPPAYVEPPSGSSNNQKDCDKKKDPNCDKKDDNKGHDQLMKDVTGGAFGGVAGAVIGFAMFGPAGILLALPAAGITAYAVHQNFK